MSKYLLLFVLCLFLAGCACPSREEAERRRTLIRYEEVPKKDAVEEDKMQETTAKKPSESEASIGLDDKNKSPEIITEPKRMDTSDSDIAGELPKKDAAEQERVQETTVETPSENEISIGLDKNKVLEILNEPKGRYTSDSEMAEVWFYEECYVGFGRDSRVIKFNRWQEE
jgi:hypothetical protein